MQLHFSDWFATKLNSFLVPNQSGNCKNNPKPFHWVVFWEKKEQTFFFFDVQKTSSLACGLDGTTTPRDCRVSASWATGMELPWKPPRALQNVLPPKVLRGLPISPPLFREGETFLRAKSFSFDLKFRYKFGIYCGGDILYRFYLQYLNIYWYIYIYLKYIKFPRYDFPIWIDHYFAIIFFLLWKQTECYLNWKKKQIENCDNNQNALDLSVMNQFFSVKRNGMFGVAGRIVRIRIKNNNIKINKIISTVNIVDMMT